MLYLLDISLINGLSSSVPNNDHVPQLINIKSFSLLGTDTRALWVSWPATETTSHFSIPSSLQISSETFPILVPVGMISVNSLLGMLRASITLSDQVCFLASNNCVVDAMEYSVIFNPVSI